MPAAGARRAEPRSPAGPLCPHPGSALFFLRAQRRVRPDACPCQASRSSAPEVLVRRKEHPVASATRMTSSWLDIRGPRTVRQFGRALGLALLATVIGCLIYFVEKCVSSNTSRFAENPLEVMVRCLGLAHFLVGWLFLFSSPQIRSRQALRRLLLCT